MSQSTLSPEPYYNSNLFSGYYLDERIADLDEWEEVDGAESAFEELQNLWDKEKSLVDSYKEDPLLESWIDEVLSILGYDTIPEPTLPDGGGYVDRLLYESEEVRREAAKRKLHDDPEGMFSKAGALLEAKQWDASFTKRFSEERQYRDASHQIKFYLERTPEPLQWGVLTNGRKWRLYGTKDYETQTFYEIDLPELLESGDVEKFKYFYLFFRPEAFREVSGSSFLDTVWNESETAAQELGEDLQDNVFTALRVLGKGFVETNDLDIDPGDEERLDELKEQSLVLLYRLMFILYAESRHLINPDDATARQQYDENFSLDQKRLEVLDTIDSGETFDAAYSEYSKSMWQRLQDLFRLIDQGEEALGIPPYNGGLFDTEEHEFLTENEVADPYLAEVIYRLSTTETEDGEFVLADYADLDTRHLGSIYEGLLEHEFRIAPDQHAAVSEDGGQVWKPATEVSVADAVETVPKGGLYVVNDEGERKSTGSYYTPDYVVTYIVEETIDPLLAEIDEDLRADGLEPSDREYFMRFWQRVQELKILDPAMGSGHFLTKAMGYLTERVMEVVRAQELQSYDEQEIRREISKECIYGVDLNGMAVELAKLSMWLETLATDQPLAFLDHHLKAGNSLVGSDITEILSMSDEDGPSGQTTLSDWMEQTRRQALEHVMDLMQDLLAIENEELSDIKEMERTYREIRDDPLFTRLLEMASVHTAGQFGLDVPDDADEQMAKALRDDSWEDVAETDWFRSAQAMAGDEQFFHWKLEFPEVFFGGSGEMADDAGFDAVVGNPPYVRIQSIRANTPQQSKYISDNYRSSTGNFDLYMAFTEEGYNLVNEGGYLGFIEPHKFFRNRSGKGLREFISESNSLHKIVSFGHEQVFDGASVYTCILILTKPDQNQFQYAKESPIDLVTRENIEFQTIDDYNDSSWIFNTSDITDILDKIREQKYTLGDISEVYVGLQTSADSIYLTEYIESDGSYTKVRSQEDSEIYKLESDILKPFLKGEDVHRYESLSSERRVIFPYRIRESKTGSKEAEFISESELQDKYPNTHNYLKSHEKALRNREGGKMDHERWFDYVYPKNLAKFDQDKILTPEIGYGGNFTYDTEDYYHKTKVYGVLVDDSIGIDDLTVLAILNSNILWFFISRTGYALRGGYFTFKKDYLYPFGIPDISNIEFSELTKSEIVTLPSWISSDTDGLDSANDLLAKIGGEMLEKKEVLQRMNLALLDHLGNYSEGESFSEIGFSQPPKNSAGSILHETTETKTKLQIERAKIERESPNTVTIHLTARYKPEDEGDYELDQYGYAETEFLPALRITDLTETEADLVEAFVPVAVDEAGGFADFRDNATKTNSLIDRLKKLTLPEVDDVEDDLANYLETKARAEELEEKIEKTDELIDQIVYELYGLTDEEIEIVESAVSD